MNLQAEQVQINRGEGYPQTDIHGVITQLSYLRGRREIYFEMGVPVPDTLADEIDACEKSIKALRRDALEARRKQLVLRKEQLKTQEEKRKDINDELEKLELELAK